ncbi:hypothetical protein SNE40_023299 [Patella caerulea]|uniref:receptor protein-tyrosine kinase n=1 Tax=Patella caerulea TaxID=87958 RepID=A0AAN8GGA6_PATCE
MAYWNRNNLLLLMILFFRLTILSSTRLERECLGTTNGFTISGNFSTHYKNLRSRYENCNIVLGNLEVTNLMDRTINYDLSFLQDIRMVTGYVLIGLLSDVRILHLPNLEIIRVDLPFKLFDQEYGLVVALTSRNFVRGLKELHLPALKEISRGKALFVENPLLCYVNTIPWNDITFGQQASVDILKHGVAPQDQCGNCSMLCERDGRGVRRCWGPEVDQCHTGILFRCQEECLTWCFNPRAFGCCHLQCAVGCYGPSDTECLTCKYFRYGGRCVPECPEGYYDIGQECIIKEKILATN